MQYFLTGLLVYAALSAIALHAIKTAPLRDDLDD